MQPTIKFTVDWSKTSTNFLDVAVSIAEGIIETDLYVKPTDSHQYLLSSSCHPFYCKQWKMVSKEILRARAIPRDALLEKVNDQEKQNKITFNITHHPVFRDVRKIFEELHVTLASDDGHKIVFPDVPMIGFKINKNLKAHLVKSRLPDFHEVGRSKPRGGKRPPCHLCENMKDTCTFKSKHLNEVHKNQQEVQL